MAYDAVSDRKKLKLVLVLYLSYPVSTEYERRLLNYPMYNNEANLGPYPMTHGYCPSVAVQICIAITELYNMCYTKNYHHFFQQMEYLYD